MISRPAVPRRYLVGPSSRHRDDHEQTPLTAPNRRPLAYDPGRKSNHINLVVRAVILVHNHPSGDPTPSQADIQMTRAIIDIATPLGIAVHDHIIVGKNGHASMKGLRLI